MNSYGKSMPNDLRLDVGGSLHLQHLDRQEPRFNLELIGWSTGESVIVKPPAAIDWTPSLTPQSNFAARAFSGTRAYGFQTSVLCIHQDPFKYFHLLYPEQISSVKIRQTPRIKIDIEAELTTAGQKIRYYPHSG